jgi:hypothetical protein
MVNHILLGIRFDIGRIIGGNYGIEAWKIFWRVVDIKSLKGGALLFSGDTSNTPSSENIYCIAIQTSDPLLLQQIRLKFEACEEYIRVAAYSPFIMDFQVLKEPLMDAGYVDPFGNLECGSYNSQLSLEMVNKENMGIKPSNKMIDFSSTLEPEQIMEIVNKLIEEHKLPNEVQIYKDNIFWMVFPDKTNAIFRVLKDNDLAQILNRCGFDLCVNDSAGVNEILDMKPAVKIKVFTGESVDDARNKAKNLARTEDLWFESDHIIGSPRLMTAYIQAFSQEEAKSKFTLPQDASITEIKTIKAGQKGKKGFLNIGKKEEIMGTYEIKYMIRNIINDQALINPKPNWLVRASFKTKTYYLNELETETLISVYRWMKNSPASNREVMLNVFKGMEIWGYDTRPIIYLFHQCLVEESKKPLFKVEIRGTNKENIYGNRIRVELSPIPSWKGIVEGSIIQIWLGNNSHQIGKIWENKFIYYMHTADNTIWTDPSFYANPIFTPS